MDITLDNDTTNVSITESNEVANVKEENISVDMTTDNIDITQASDDTETILLDGTYNVSPLTSYLPLSDKPKINSIELINNKTSSQLGLQDEMSSLSNTDIDDLLNNFV